MGKRKGQRSAKRLKRVFTIEVSICSACVGLMKTVVSIEDAIVISKIFVEQGNDEETEKFYV